MTDQAKSALALSDEEIAEKVIAIVSQQSMIEAKEVTMDSTPEELGIDSLGLVEIVFAIEETFDITVPYNANDQASSDFDISSVGAVVGAVKKLMAAQASA